MLVCNRKKLLDVINVMSSVSPSASSKPILENVKFEVSDDKLHVSATDLETSLCLTIDYIECDEDMEFLLPCKKLKDILSSLDVAEVKFEKDDLFCVITSGNDNFELLSMLVSEFPDIGIGVKGKKIEMMSSELKELLDRTSFSASADATIYTMNSVCFEVKNGEINLCATDGKRLSLCTKPISYDDYLFMLISLNSVNVITKLLDDDRLVNVFPLENSLVLQHEGMYLRSRLLQGTFPPYDAVLEQKPEFKIAVDRSEFLKAIKKSTLLTTKESRNIQLTFKDGVITFDSCNPELGSSKILSEYKGDEVDISISLNSIYLKEGFSHLNSDYVNIELIDSGSRITVNEDICGDGNHLMCIMPLNP